MKREWRKFDCGTKWKHGYKIVELEYLGITNIFGLYAKIQV